jgi:hypothetical protein
MALPRGVRQPRAWRRGAALRETILAQKLGARVTWGRSAMARRSGSRGGTALDGALKSFRNPKSDLHKRAKRSLTALGASHKKLGLRFANRASRRQDQENKLRDRRLTEAQALLTKLKAQAVEWRKLNNEDLTSVAEIQVKGQEAHIDSLLRSAASPDPLMSKADEMEEALRIWNDALVASAVDALWSDTAGDRAAAMLSAGLIVAGVVGGPAAAALTAAASAGLVVRDQVRRLDRARSTAKADQEVARMERALGLIDRAKNLTDEWLTTLP